MLPFKHLVERFHVIKCWIKHSEPFKNQYDMSKNILKQLWDLHDWALILFCARPDLCNESCFLCVSMQNPIEAILMIWQTEFDYLNLCHILVFLILDSQARIELILRDIWLNIKTLCRYLHYKKATFLLSN